MALWVEVLFVSSHYVVVGKRVRGATVPVIVCGDLNDVAWSRTTRLFQKTSRLLDPRKGRGLFNTFDARIPVFRFPLDHIFHSDSLRVVTRQRLPNVGSDHFPVYASLSYEPSASREQQAPTADEADKHEANKTISQGKSSRLASGNSGLTHEAVRRGRFRLKRRHGPSGLHAVERVLHVVSSNQQHVSRTLTNALRRFNEKLANHARSTCRELTGRAMALAKRTK